MKQVTFVSLIEKNFDLKGKLLRSEMALLAIALEHPSFLSQYRIIYAFYLMAKGRNYSVEVTRKFVLAMCMFVWSHSMYQSRLRKFFAEFIDSIFEEDAQLPSIQRFFPEYFSRMKPSTQMKSYLGNTENLFASYKKSSVFASITSMLSVYAGINEDDLFDLLKKFGELVSLRDFELAYKATKKSLAAGKTNNIDSTAAEIIAKSVSNAHLLATLEKYSFDVESFGAKAAKELYTLANRYDILTGIEKNLQKRLAAAPRITNEIVDVFIDFQQSKIRKKFQKVFLNRTAKYFQS